MFGPQFSVPDCFAYSDGWLGKFKKLQGIKQVVKHDEANDADTHGVELACNAIPKIVNAGGYAAQDIYNQDETGQFWRPVCCSVRWQQTSGREESKTSSASWCRCAAMPLAQTSVSCL
jgi:hypothetical protein